MNDVLAALQSADEETRYQAVRAAQALPAERRLQVGQQALGDEAWRVRKAATELLLAHPDREAVLEIFVARLGDEANAGARNAAAEALTALGAEAVDALHAVARSRDVDQRKFAADILGEGGAPAAVEPLVALLDDTDVNVRAAAAEALGKVGDDRARAALLERVASEDLLVRLSALEGLVRLGAVVPLERLSPLLSERLLRRPVLRLLARVETPAALDHLLEAVSDPSPGTREIALASIGTWVQRTGDETALRESLAHRDPTPILRAARAALSGEASAVYGALTVLAALRDVEALEALPAAAQHERLRPKIVETALTMGAAAGRRLGAWLEHPEPAVRAIALEVLGELGDPAFLPAILQALESDPDAEVREAAVAGLAAMDDARAIEPLARQLGRDRGLAAAAIEGLVRLAGSHREQVLEACRACLGEEEALRVADACRLIGRVGGAAEVPLLAQVIRHEDPRARAAAMEAMGRLRVADALDPLRFGLADEASVVRVAAAKALGWQMEREAAAEALQIALRDEEAAVAGAAAESLGRLGLPEYAPELLTLVGGEGGPGSAPAAWAALRALAELGATELARALPLAAAHPEGEVAKEAARIAASLPGEVGKSVLLACARHTSWDVRRRAAIALANRADADLLGELESLLAQESDPLVAEALERAVRSHEERSKG